MNLTKQLFLIMLFFGFAVLAQDNESAERKPGHTNENKFKQLKDELATPNAYHTASGKPGPLYTQQKVDYTMDIILDDENQRLYGNEAIVYHNNSQDTLEYLWIQLEQNKRALDSKSPDIEGDGVSAYYEPISYSEEFLKTPFDGGFKLQEVKDSKGKDLKYTVNRTTNGDTYVVEFGLIPNAEHLIDTDFDSNNIEYSFYYINSCTYVNRKGFSCLLNRSI